MLTVRPEIAAMKGYVPGEQPRGNEAVKLNTNENPYRASEAVYDAIRHEAEIGLSRYPNAVAQPFRIAAARLFDVEPDWIVCGNGSDDILTILTRTFVGQGDLLRLAYPSYILYGSLAELQGAYSEEIMFKPDWTLPRCFGRELLRIVPERVSEFVNAPLRLAFLPNPNSPTGTILSPERIEELAANLPCPLVVDEAYADFAGTSCIGLVKKHENIIVTRTLSKSYALAGLRFGFLIAQPQCIEQLMKAKDSYNCDSLSIAAATAAINDQDWLAENRRKIIATRQRLTQGMRQLGFTAPDSAANFTWNVHPDKAVSHKAIYEYLKENGYLVRYMNYEHTGDGLRISVGTDEQIDRCLELIKKFM